MMTRNASASQSNETPFVTRGFLMTPSSSRMNDTVTLPSTPFSSDLLGYFK
jgi:hypothetical protein